MIKLTAAATTEMSERRKKLAIVDDLNDVIEKIDEVLGKTTTTASSSRQKREAGMTCSLFDETLDDLIDIANDTSKQKIIATYADSLTTATIGTCTDDEMSNLEADKESLEAIVTDYESELCTASAATITAATSAPTVMTYTMAVATVGTLLTTASSRTSTEMASFY